MTHETFIAIEPIPANPGYTAHITGRLADPECDPSGFGMTRLEAALDLSGILLDVGDMDGSAHPCTCLAIAAVLREDMAVLLKGLETPMGPREVYERAIALVEGIA